MILEMYKNYKITNSHICKATLLLALLCSATSVNADSSETTDKQAFTKVTTQALSELLISANNSVPATIVSLNHATIGAQLSAKVNAVKVKTGDTVKKGTTLVELDCRDYTLTKKQTEAALTAAKAQEALANKQYTRNLHLRKLKTIPQNLLDESILQTQVARADIAVKRSALQQSKLSIERCKIKAPYTGQITERLVSVGQLLAPSTPVFQLLQTNELEIEANLSSDRVISAKKSSRLYYRYGNLKVPVSFRSVVNEIKQGSRTLAARLTPKDNEGLIVGASGRLEWIGKQSLLPADYVVRRNNQLGVLLFVHKNNSRQRGKVRFHPLTDAKEGQPVYVYLPATSQIITSSRFRLKNDQAVEIKAEAE